MAKEAYEAAPADPYCAVTYAFALYNTGRTVEGLEALKKLPSDALDDPHLALYAALLLLDHDEYGPAKTYAAKAEKGPLYPEEKKLLDEILARIAAQPEPSPEPSAPPAQVSPPPSDLSSPQIEPVTPTPAGQNQP